MKETKPNQIIDAEFTNIPNKPSSEKPPENKNENKSLNSKGHERMANMQEFFKKCKDGLMNGAKSVGGKLFKLFKSGKTLATEGVATLLSIDDIAKRGAIKVKDAAVSVKDAAVQKTTETVTDARDVLVDAYKTTKEKGEAVLQKGKETVVGIRDAYLKFKLEIALASIKRKKERSEEKTTQLKAKYDQKMALLAQFS